MANVDFTEQISNFRSAQYGADVRESLIDVAEAVETACNNQLITVDSTLSQAGQGADAKEVGDQLDDLKSQIALLSGVPTAVKNAIDTLFQNVAFKNDDLYTDEIAVVHNWATAVNLISISAVFNQGANVIYDTDSLDSLKQYLTVTALYDNGTSETVSGYTLSGELTEGTSIVTVTYSGKTATFNVTVTQSSSLWTFVNGKAIVKSSGEGQLYISDVSARACGDAPIANRGYVFTVTDSSKYSLAAYDATSNVAVDGRYTAGDKAVSWVSSDSVSTEYVWLSLKKNDGTAFTTAELANGAEAVFTYTANG